MRRSTLPRSLRACYRRQAQQRALRRPGYWAATGGASNYTRTRCKSIHALEKHPGENTLSSGISPIERSSPTNML